MPGRNKQKIGRKGEAIAEDSLLTEVKGEFLFDPAFLGETFPDIDFYVQLSQNPHNSLFFLVQVKSTFQGYDKDNNLSVACPIDNLKALADIPAPTYILGVDALNKKVYARFVKAPVNSGFSSLPTNFELTPSNLELLHNEVVDYWENAKTLNYKLKFKSITHD